MPFVIPDMSFIMAAMCLILVSSFMGSSFTTFDMSSIMEPMCFIVAVWFIEAALLADAMGAAAGGIGSAFFIMSSSAQQAELSAVAPNRVAVP